MRYWRIFFLLAGCFNVFGGVLGLLDWQRPLLEEGLPAPNYPFFAQLLFVAVIIFGIGYLMVWRDPLANRGIVVLGLLAKIAGMAMTWRAVALGQLPAEPFAIQPLFADLPWAIGFALFLIRTRAERPSARAGFPTPQETP
jgi:hypothetical protein